MNTGLVDKAGTEIHIGDRLLFSDENLYKGARWSAITAFEHGVVTINYQTAVLHANPDDWKYPHSWLKSRGWSVDVGVGHVRNSLYRIAGGRVRGLLEIDVEVIGESDFASLNQVDHYS